MTDQPTLTEGQVAILRRLHYALKYHEISTPVNDAKVAALAAILTQREADTSIIKHLTNVLADYDNRITWFTTCQQCANLMDKSYQDYEKIKELEQAAAAHVERIQQLETALKLSIRQSNPADFIFACQGAELRHEKERVKQLEKRIENQRSELANLQREYNHTVAVANCAEVRHRKEMAAKDARIAELTAALTVPTPNAEFSAWLTKTLEEASNQDLRYVPRAEIDGYLSRIKELESLALIAHAAIRKYDCHCGSFDCMDGCQYGGALDDAIEAHKKREAAE